MKKTFILKKESYKRFLILTIKTILLFIILLLKNNNKTKTIEIDNIINEEKFKNNINFSNFNTNQKIVSIYIPQFHNEQFDFNNNSKILKSYKTNEINFNESLIEYQVKLAKNHGIFGFGIIYNLDYGIKINEKIFNLFANDNELNFPYFIILNYNFSNSQQNKNSLIKNMTFVEKDMDALIYSIENYFSSKNYIKLNGKSLLGVFYSSLISKFIRYIRKDEFQNKKESKYIISINYGNNSLHNSKISSKINSIVEYPSQNIGFGNQLNKLYFYNFYYYNLFKNRTVEMETINNFFIVNGCKPEKFYIIFKEYLNLYKSINNSFILFNAWNNYKENSFLEPNEEFGYSYLNYFSKALFNINDEIIYNLSNLNNKCSIAVQMHLFYEDLIDYIVNKTNNIPIKFDLYITIISCEIYDNIENFIKRYSKANYFEILIVENRGRDILPLLTQFKKKFRFYKYLCHVHSKKSQHSKELGFLWRNYLFNNLLGNTTIISEILYDFENNEKLGFIFPEVFHGVIKPFYIINNGTKIWMEFIFYKLFRNYKIGKLLNFPAGNMFWAKIEAIFQIFKYDFNKYFPLENNQTRDTFMHGMERIWLYLVKYNDFEYKTLFKSF